MFIVQCHTIPHDHPCWCLFAAHATQQEVSFRSFVLAKAVHWNTMQRFADTVRFRVRGLTVDHALSTGHNRIIRGGAVMPFTCYFASACRQTVFMSFVAWFWMSFRAREAQSEAKGAVSPCKTCVRRSHATLFLDKTMSWQLGEGSGGSGFTNRARASAS